MAKLTIIAITVSLFIILTQAKKNCKGPLEQADICCSKEPRLVPLQAHNKCKGKVTEDKAEDKKIETKSADNKNIILIVPFKNSVPNNKRKNLLKAQQRQKTSKKSRRSASSKDQAVNNTAIMAKGQRSDKEHKSYIGPCVMDCVFKDENYYTSNGNIDWKTVKTAFEDGLDPVWKPIVDVAVKNCSERIKEYEQSNTPKASCNLRAKMFMVCVRRHLALNCPKENIVKNETSCKEKLEDVRNCDSFAVSTPTTPTPVATNIKKMKTKAEMEGDDGRKSVYRPVAIGNSQIFKFETVEESNKIRNKKRMFDSKEIYKLRFKQSEFEGKNIGIKDTGVAGGKNDGKKLKNPVVIDYTRKPVEAGDDNADENDDENHNDDGSEDKESDEDEEEDDDDDSDDDNEDEDEDDDN